MKAESWGPVHRGPGLRPYRPRKAPSVVYVEGPSLWEWSVLVLRMGPEWPNERADALARSVWPDSELPMREPMPVWVRHVPWDTSGHGFDSTWETVAPTTKGAIPALEYAPRHADLVATNWWPR